MANRTPRIVKANGDRAMCHEPEGGHVLSGNDVCVRIAVYPDGKCARHTCYLDGLGHHERILADQVRDGSARKRAWEEWRKRRA